MGGPGETVFALLGAIVFSGYIVFDTENLISRYVLLFPLLTTSCTGIVLTKNSYVQRFLTAKQSSWIVPPAILKVLLIISILVAGMTWMITSWPLCPYIWCVSLPPSLTLVSDTFLPF